MPRTDAAKLARIRIYPIKSLEGFDVPKSTFCGLGGLAGDREYRLVDDRGRVANAKRLGESILKIRCSYGQFGRTFEFGEWADDDAEQYLLPDDINELAFAFANRLGENLRMERNSLAGFPDDEVASGPTIVSTATLLEVASWFGWDEEECRRRFRANLEIDGVPPFWEDRLFGDKGEQRLVRIGSATLEAMYPCARCAVPSRDSRTGKISDPGFAKIFAEQRQETFPSWARRSRFDHFYRLCVNTRIPPSGGGKTIATGDVVELAQ